MSRRTWLPAVLLVFFATLLQAQPPPGRYVVASIRPPGGPDGGLFLVHPRESGPVVPITGLGPDLTGQGAVGRGARSVIVRPDDQARPSSSESSAPGSPSTCT